MSQTSKQQSGWGGCRVWQCSATPKQEVIAAVGRGVLTLLDTQEKNKSISVRSASKCSFLLFAFAPELAPLQDNYEQGHVISLLISFLINFYVNWKGLTPTSLYLGNNP